MGDLLCEICGPENECRCPPCQCINCAPPKVRPVTRPDEMAEVILCRNGRVMVDGVCIPGHWYEVESGEVYFEDSGVLSTDEMSEEALRKKLAEMYSWTEESK